MKYYPIDIVILLVVLFTLIGTSGVVHTLFLSMAYQLFYCLACL